MFRIVASNRLRLCASRSTAATSSWSHCAPAVMAATRAFSDADGAAPAVTPPKADAVWALWNEGNLFSLSIGELRAYLAAQGVQTGDKLKKAALVRQVEDTLRQAEQQKKQRAGGGGAQAERDMYGEWAGDRQQPGGRPVVESLMDLSGTAFYDPTSGAGSAAGAAASITKSFQLLSAGTSPDVVLARVNSTSFPGFAASAECFTFSAAEAAQSTRARFSKAAQWALLNARRAGVPVEVVGELGKVLLSPRGVVHKNRTVVSAYTLQQRMQQQQQGADAAPAYSFISTTGAAAAADVAALLQAEGFSAPSAVKRTYDVTVRRKHDSVSLVLDSTGVVREAYTEFVNVQQSLLVQPTVGQDVRFLLRTRRPVDPSPFGSAPVLDIQSEAVQSRVPQALGEAMYASEDDKRAWRKALPGGGEIVVTETQRQPVIISRDEEDGQRTEYSVSALVRHDAGAIDLAALTTAVYDLSARVAAAAQPHFLAQYKLEAQPVSTQ